MAKKPNRGYLVPDKSKGRIDVNGEDVFFSSEWDGPNKDKILFSPELGKGEGFLRSNDKKTKESQPDWRGNFIDGNGMRWLVSAWDKDKNGEFLVSVAITDPDTLGGNRRDNKSAERSSDKPEARVERRGSPEKSPEKKSGQDSQPSSKPETKHNDDEEMFDFGDIFNQD